MSAYRATSSTSPGSHDLGHDFEPGLVARRRHHLQRRFAETLERVRRGARLERAAPQHLGALLGDVARRVEKHLFAFHRARAGHHHDLVAADLHAAHVDDGVDPAELSARELEGLGDGDDLVDSAEVGERLLVGVGVAADDPDQRPLLALGELGLEPDLVDAIDHRIHLCLGRAVGHDDDHGINVPRR